MKVTDTARIVASAATAAAVTGSLLLAATPQQAAGSVAAVRLASADSAAGPASALQQAIDQVLAATQQAQAYNAALPFATPTSTATLPTVLQNTNYELLISILSMQVPGLYFRSPELVAGDAANPRQYFQFFNPDFHYQVKPGLNGDATYQLTGTLGNGTEHLTISAGQISAESAETHQYLESGSTLVTNPDGSFTVTIGPTPPPDGINYIDTTDTTVPGVGTSLLIRDMMGDWALGPGHLGVQCVADCPQPPTGTGLSPEQLVMLLSGLAQAIGPFNQQNMTLAANAGIQLAPNTMSPLEPQTFFGVGLPTARVSAGNFDLQPGQALIVKIPDVESSYSGIQLMNVFASALPYTLAQTSLNNTQAFHAGDGYTYYVIAASNPGVANWLDSGTIGTGEVFARFEGLPEGAADPTGLAVTTQVVPLDEVRDYLPADTPTVSPAEFAADLTARVLSYDYALDVSRQSSWSLKDLTSIQGSEWLIQQVLLHDIKAMMGADQFEAVFGSEPATPMWLRLTPALSPDWLMLTKDLLTHPSASFAALAANLDLALQEITQPALLAVALLQQDLGRAADAVQTAISAGQPLDALQALLTAGLQIGGTVADALFDPNSSITAGILNARDDLATAVFAANGGFPTVASPLATLEWQVLPQLVDQGLGALLHSTAPDLTDLAALLNPADYLAMLLS